MFIKYIYEYVISALAVRPATLPYPLPIQPHTPISGSTLDMGPEYKQGQARCAHTRPSDLTHFATGISAHSVVQVKVYSEENTELSLNFYAV